MADEERSEVYEREEVLDLASLTEGELEGRLKGLSEEEQGRIVLVGGGAS